MVGVSSWGRLGTWEHEVRHLGDAGRLAGALSGDRPCLPRGMGRSYGDVCINPDGILLDAVALDRLQSFDPGTGRLRCEAGVLLRDIQQLFVPRGWKLPVTPGTQMITVGGAIANDVHGKNHHRSGSFGDHVLSVRLMRTDGTTTTCAPDIESDWFAATVGGMGLTGLVTEAELQLSPTPGPWLATETIPYAGLDAFFSLADESESAWEHTVSWIDCIGQGPVRGLFMRANPTTGGPAGEPRAKAKVMPFVPPFSLVNRWTLQPFNTLYYHLQKSKPQQRIEHYTSYSYPLDNLHHWNRMYGPNGFYQYQMVIPRPTGRDGIGAMLDRIRASGEGSFLAVLKTFGDRVAPGMMSFPRPGVTLALDFPNLGASTQRLFDQLDAIVREHGGRIYAAKDARMPKDLFTSGYPRLAEFLPYRDPGISSAMSRRLMGS